jgi:hypothetical protein
MTQHRCWFFILLCLQLFLLLACTSAREKKPEPTGIEIDGVIIRNELAYQVTEVQLLVPLTGNFVSCGNITARSQCSTKFPNRDYYANEVIISWKEYGQPQKTGPFVIGIPDHLERGKPALLEVIIFNAGQAGAKLVQ